MKYNCGDEVCRVNLSCPARGTWIEMIVMALWSFTPLEVVPRKGHVD